MTLLVGSLPIYQTVDTNKDSVVNIEDAIINMKKLANVDKNVSKLHGFKNNFRDVLTTLAEVSKLENNKKTNVDVQFKNITPQLDKPFLINTFIIFVNYAEYLSSKNYSISYTTLDLSPESPPPIC